MSQPRDRIRRGALTLAVVATLAAMGAGPPTTRPSGRSDVGINRPVTVVDEPRPSARPVAPEPKTPPAGPATGLLALDPQQAARSLQTVALFAVVSFAPAGVLMLTAFVRINVVLMLLRQALGSPQVPGNQVLTALALLLTAMVMKPTGETVYRDAVEPFARGGMTWTEGYQRASAPIKTWMVGQIYHTRHEHYLWELHDLAFPAESGHPEPAYREDFPMRVVAPAFLLSELTTAMLMGFYLYLPFLVIDLVTAAVLSSAGLFMLPPSLVALPLKLILFVLADGWLEVAGMLVRSFGPPATLLAG
jgi:flagellar biosynthetic protein FliP